MNYPVWYIPILGGPLLMAFIAVLHVFISHFAVGGGLWLVLTEKKAYREKKDYLLEYVIKHCKFFILLTMVLGSITGVGIWFTISLISPDATSSLIHSFVFGWAIEWVFFIIEIVTAFIYFYTFKKVSQKFHLLIGWIYFISAWISLLIINAIISFMLTPGRWLETGSFWDGVFNPGLLPSTVFRTFICLALAGSYALLTAARKVKPGPEREEVVKYNGKWMLYSLAGLIPSMVWYYFSLPDSAKTGLSGSSKIMGISLIHLLASLAVFSLLLLIFTFWKRKKFRFLTAVFILLSIFVFFGSFEFIREAGRKPFVIKDYIYPTGIRLAEYKNFKDKSALQQAIWVETKSLTKETMLKGGEELFRIECAACHSLGIKNNIMGKVKTWDFNKMVRMLGNLPGLTGFMPGFWGTETEKQALAYWLYYQSHGQEPDLISPPALQTRSEGQVSGEDVFATYCGDCHEIEGDDSISILIQKYNSLDKITNALGRLDQIDENMPAFEGSDQEKKALAEFLYKMIAGGKND